MVLDQSTLERIYPETPDGVRWVEEWQRRLDLTVDGKLGPITQAQIAYRMGPLGEGTHTQVPMPEMHTRWLYDHAGTTWPYRDDALTEATSAGRWQDGMVRFVAGFRPKFLTYSRGAKSCVSLDTVSLGIPHWHAGTLGAVLREFCTIYGPACASVWGGVRTNALANGKWMEVLEASLPARFRVHTKRGNLVTTTGGLRRLGVLGRREVHRHYWGLSWLWAGWRELMTDCSLVDWQAQKWLSKYVPRGYRIARRAGLTVRGSDAGRVLAACTRMGNSNASKAIRWLREVDGSDLERIKKVLTSDDMYGEPDEWVRVSQWSEFRQAPDV